MVIKGSKHISIAIRNLLFDGKKNKKKDLSYLHPHYWIALLVEGLHVGLWLPIANDPL